MNIQQNLKFDYDDEIKDGYTEYFSLGCDYEGQLGHGQDPLTHDRTRHVTLPKSLSFDILIKSVACGGAHTLILSKTGELFSIGSNEFGQLGLNDRQLKFTTAPLLIQEAKNMNVEIK
jgi:alpha-tubulin suppressor-like RCC1 family protein